MESKRAQKMMRRCFLAVLTLPLLASFGSPARAATMSVKVSWPAPKNPLELTRKAGLIPERRESLIFHVHAHLAVFVNGQHVVVPAGIGINIHDPGVKHSQTAQGPSYGGISMCRHPCISPLHTHDTSGVIHTESANFTPHQLGQFFIEWGVRFSARCVDVFCSPRTKIAVYLDGKRYLNDPTKMRLLDHLEIAVVVGTPPRHIPSSYAW